MSDKKETKANWLKVKATARILYDIFIKSVVRSKKKEITAYDKKALTKLYDYLKKTKTTIRKVGLDEKEIQKVIQEKMILTIEKAPKKKTGAKTRYNPKSKPRSTIAIPALKKCNRVRKARQHQCDEAA